MAILRPYKVNSYRRLCDVCGRPRQIEDIRFADGTAICSLHPQYRTALQLNRINARVRPTRILPVPQPKPFAPVDTYTVEEAQIFNFVTKTAPFETVNVKTNAGAITGNRTLPSITWALAYLTGLIVEDERPATWLTYARTKAIALADLLITTQTPTTSGDAFTGGFDPTVLDGTVTQIYTAADTGVGLAGLCRLYQATGAEKYLRAAKLAAGFIVTLQASNLATFDSETAVGPPQHGYDHTNGEYLLTFYPGDLVCLWGLSLLKAITGDISIGPTAAGKSNFTSDPTRLISVSMEQMRSFWATGYGGVNGFSAATPFSFLTAVGSTVTWGGTTITTSDWAAGVFSLAEVYGITSQVSDLWTFLRSLTGQGIDATLAPPTTFVGSAATSASYDWASAGLLARATASKARASLKTVKDTLSVPRQRYTEATPRSGETLYLGPLGISGTSFQPITDGATKREQSVTRASQVSLVYRQAPQGFTGQGH